MLSFNNIDVKTGISLPIPPKQADHTYLEHLLGERVNDPNLKLAVGKMYEGVIEADLEALQAQGLYLMMASGQTAYFGDAETAALLVGETGLFQNHSDAVAYALPTSEAAASLVTTQGRVLVIDDEAVDADGNPSPYWGGEPVLLADGQPASEALLEQAAGRLGDGYTLISSTKQRALVEQPALDKLNRLGAIVLTNTAISLDGEPTPETLTTPLQDLLRESVGDAALTLELQVKRDGSVVVKWDAGEQRGKALLTSTGDGTYQATVVGGNEALQSTVNQSFNAFQQGLQTPFQYRAGMTQWQGAMKGTCRASELCEALGVQAIIPLSAIKGDAVKDGGKTVRPGIHTLDEGALFWAYKTPAKTIQQRLGAQALVNLPEGTRSDVLPKIESRVAELATAQSDPRLVADLYIASYERRQDQLEADPEFDAAEKRVDWLYEALKADVRPITVVTGLESIPSDTPITEDVRAQLQALAAQGLGIDAFVEQANPLLSDELPPFTVDSLLNSTEGAFTVSTDTRGGYSQLIEHAKVVDELERFMQSEWEDVATGGMYVPCAVAQPHRGLGPNEVCFKDLPHGAQVALYRSPVANVAAFDVFTNNLEAIRTTDWEAYQQNGVSYMNPATAKRLVIDFDGDRVAIIPAEDIQPTKTQTLEGLGEAEVFIPNLPHGQAVTLYHSGNQCSTFTNNIQLRDTVAGEINDRPERLSQVFIPPSLDLNPDRPVHVGYYDGLHGYQRLHAEVLELNAPDRKPVQVEKEKKIPRNAANGFPTLASAALDAADNPTGAVANNGMKLEALRWDLLYTPDADKEGVLDLVSGHAAKLLKDALDPKHELVIPPPTAKGYDFKAALQAIARSQTLVNVSDPAVRLEQVKAQLALVDRFLFQVEGLNAVQLQRAVDTPKSALVVNKAEFSFCREVAGYQDVGWVKEKNELDLYRNGRMLTATTHDPVSWLVRATNAQYQDSRLESQVNRSYRQLCPQDTFTAEQGKVALTVATTYNSQIAQSIDIENVAKTEAGPTLLLKMQQGRELKVTNLTLFDPSGAKPIWAAKAGQPLDIKIVRNEKTSRQASKEMGKGWKTHKTHEYRVEAIIDGQKHTIGTLSPQSVADLSQWQGNSGRGIDGTDMQGLTPKLGISMDREDAKQLRLAADANLKPWGESIPPTDRTAYCHALWHNQGQKLAIKLFPEVMAEQLAEFRLHETRAIGLQFETNEWGASLPTGPVAVRVAIETADNNNRGKTVIQLAAEDGQWKSLGPVSSDFYSLPIGTVAQATVAPNQVDQYQLTTKQGVTVFMKPLKGVDLEPTQAGSGYTVQFKFSLDKKGLVMMGDPPAKVGELTTESVATIRDIEQRSGSRIFNNPEVRRSMALAVGRYKDATLTVTEPVIPDQWCKKGDIERWQSLESGLTAPTLVVDQAAVAVAPSQPVTIPDPVQAAPTPLDVVATEAPNKPIRLTPRQAAVPKAPTPNSQPEAITPDLQALQTAYDGYMERVKLVYSIMGNNNPSVQEIDTAIVVCIQQTVTPSKQGEALHCLQRSPNVIKLKEQGYEAAAAYVNQVLAPVPLVQPTAKKTGLER